MKNTLSEITAEVVDLQEKRSLWRKEKEALTRPVLLNQRSAVAPYHRKIGILQKAIRKFRGKITATETPFKNKIKAIEADYLSKLEDKEQILKAILKKKGIGICFPKGELPVDDKILTANRNYDCEYREDCLNVACYEGKVRGPVTYSCKNCQHFKVKP